MSIKGIIFDFDGTLADTTDLIVATYTHVLREHCGLTPTREQIIATFGLPLGEGLLALSQRPEQLEELRLAYRDFNLEHHDAMIRPFPQVGELLAALKARGLRTAIVTSKKPPMLERGLRCLGLVDYIDARVPFGATEHSKPHAEPSLAALRLLDLRPEECLVVGDSPYDLQSGRGAGMRTVAVRYTGFAWEQMLAEGQPDFVIENPLALVKLIDELNNNLDS